MQKLIPVLTACSIAFGLMLAGCKEKTGSSGATDPVVHDPHDGHDHGADDTDAHAGDDDDHGDEQMLGSLTIDGVTIDVSIDGDVAPNADIHVDIVQTGGPAPAAIRLWIGDESATGTMKVKMDGEDDYFHGHAEAPAELGANTALWVEVESTTGDRSAQSLPLP